MSFLRLGLSSCLKTQGLESVEGWGVFRHIQPPAQSLNSRPGPMRPTATNTSNVSGMFFLMFGNQAFEGAARWSCQWRSMCRSRVFCPLHLLGGTESFSLVSTCWSPMTQQITVVSIGSHWQSLEIHAKQYRFSKTEDSLQQQILERDALRLQAGSTLSFEYIWITNTLLHVGLLPVRGTGRERGRNRAVQWTKIDSCIPYHP